MSFNSDRNQQQYGGMSSHGSGGNLVGAGGPLGNAGANRRGTGGLSNFGPSDHRLLDSQISDLFNRQRAGGGPGGMGEHGLDLLSGAHRGSGRPGDSLENSAAVLDACILDLTRRRLSMATQAGGGNSGPGGPSTGGPSGSNAGAGGPADFNQESFGGGGGGGGGPGGYSAGGGSPGPNSHLSISLRQKQLQSQQFELEQRQRELERQRQQLLAGIQETQALTGVPPGAMGMSELGGSGMGGGGNNRGGGGNNGLPNGGPIGLDGGGGSRQQQQWWVCHVCNSRAFSSRDEAMQHELICSDGPAGGSQGGQSQPHRSMGMGGLGAGGSSALSSLGGGGGPGGSLGQMIDRLNAGGQGFGAGGPGFGGSSAPAGMVGGMGAGGSQQSDNTPSTSSNGPFAMMSNPMPLAMDTDSMFLTPLHCFVRKHCVQVFCATPQDVATPSKGKRKPIQVGQVGLRCPHCYTQPGGSRERGAMYYPTTISSIYNATMNLLQRHLHSCSAVPEDIMRRYQTLKSDDARSGTSKKYWVESALSLGLVDTPTGIRFTALPPPPLPRLTRHQHDVQNAERRNSNDMYSTKSNALGTDEGNNNQNGDHNDQSVPNDTNDDNSVNNNHDGQASNNQDGDNKSNKGGDNKDNSQGDSAPLVTAEDKPYATAFSYHLLCQMKSCVFTEADRLGKRKGLPQGFKGLACTHCYGCFGSGRFFPSSIKTLSDTSKTLNVLHNHMMRCRKCPQEVKDQLEKLREHHDDERAKMKFGSQKAFFAKIWRRLHENDGNTGIPNSLKRKNPSVSQQQQQQQPQMPSINFPPGLASMAGGSMGMGHGPSGGMGGMGGYGAYPGPVGGGGGSGPQGGQNPLKGLGWEFPSDSKRQRTYQM